MFAGRSPPSCFLLFADFRSFLLLFIRVIQPPISAATSKMAKMLTNLRSEVSRRGVLGTLMAWHRGYLRPGVNSVLVGTDERGNRYFEATELPFGTNTSSDLPFVPLLPSNHPPPRYRKTTGQDRWVEYSTSDDWGHDYDASQVPPAWYVLSVPMPNYAVVGLIHSFRTI
jgi:hypothetical protein